MDYIFLLSKENVRLSTFEVVYLLNLKKYKVYNNLLVTEINEKEEKNERILEKFKRLAYTKKIYQFLFISTEKKLIEDIKRFNWNKIYKKNFCIRIFEITERNKIKKEEKIKYSEEEIADVIWKHLKNPTVNLTNPKTPLHFYFLKEKVIVGKLMYENTEDFEARKAHKRPELHPTSMHPKLARCLLNLCSAENSIVDPFCGSGGILIEAGLIGLKCIGYDISEPILKKARINLNYYKIKNFKLVKKDATKLTKTIDYVVTDLPYGRGTQKVDLDKLYLNFLKKLKTLLKKRAVIVFPHYINYQKIIKKSKSKVINEFSYYIHGSLTKKILILEP